MDDGKSPRLEMRACARIRRRAVIRLQPMPYPENLQTASRETIVSGGFEEREKRQRQRAD